MTAQLFNNVSDVLLNPVDATQTEIQVQSGNIPSIEPGDYTPIYVIRDNGAFEIMHVTAVDGTTLTVTRGAEGSDPLFFESGVTIQIRPTRQSLFDMDMEIDSKTITTSTGTQALSDALDDRLTEAYFTPVRPEEFGATGDGVSDDTLALQAALDSGSPVDIANDYLVSAPLIVPRPCEISGVGSITTTASDSNCLEVVQGSALVSIQGVSIRGQHTLSSSTHTAGSNGIRGLGTALSMSENIVVDGVNIRGFGENGMRFDFCDHLVIRNNEVNTCGRAGIQFRSCHHVLIEENDIIDITPGGGGVAPFLNAYGIHMTQDNAETRVSEHFEVLRNRIIRVPSWTGIDTHGGQHLNIRGNRVQSCYLGIVIMGPGGGSSSTVSASHCNVVDNYIFRDGEEAPNSRAGIAIIPSSSGVSSAPARYITVSGNRIERHGNNVTGESLEGAIRIQDVLGLSCTTNTLINSSGTGIQVSAGFFAQVFGDISHNTVTNVLSFDGQAFYARFSNSGGDYTFDNNTLYRLGGDAIGIFSDVAPSSPDRGVRLGADNTFIGFVDGTAARRKFPAGHPENLSSRSNLYTRGVWKVGANSSGVIVSASPAISSVTRTGVGTYVLDFNLDEFNPGGTGGSYYLELQSRTGSPVVFGQARTASSATVTTYDVNANLVDREFTATGYWLNG